MPFTFWNKQIQLNKILFLSLKLQKVWIWMWSHWISHLLYYFEWSVYENKIINAFSNENDIFLNAFAVSLGNSQRL